MYSQLKQGFFVCTPLRTLKGLNTEHVWIVETNSRRGDSIMRKMGLPKPTGEYAVGTFTYTVKDDRKEIMRQGGMRSVAARVYYPVLRESVKGLTKAVALSDNIAERLKGYF